MSAPDSHPERRPEFIGDEVARGFFEREQARHAKPEPEKPEAPEPEGEASEAEEPEPVEASPDGEEPEAEDDGAEESEYVELSDDALIEVHDGEQVSLADLKKRYGQEKAFTQKAETLARERREFEAERQRVEQQGRDVEQRLGELVQGLEAEYQRLQPSAEELNRLRQEDPGRWSAVMLELRRRKEMIAVAQGEQQQLAKRRIDEAIPREVAALKEKIPAFRDDFDTEYERLTKYAVDPAGGGLTPEEWSGLYDHRHVALVHKAMRYDEAARSKGSVTRKLARKPKVVRSSVQRAPGDTAGDRYKAALDRQAQTGSFDATVDAFREREAQRRSRRGPGGPV